MALVQIYEMEAIVRGVVESVRKEAKAFGMEEGVVAICYSNDPSYLRSKQIPCFELLPEEERLRIFPIKENSSFVLRDDALKDKADCFGVAVMKIAAAKEIYTRSLKGPLTSKECYSQWNIPGRHNWGGCVTFPLKINGQRCGFIYVSVSGGTEDEDEACAWAAYESIRRGLVACCTANPGRVKYEEGN